MSLKRFIKAIRSEPLNPLLFLLLLSIVSFIPWKKRPQRSLLGIAALTHSETAKEERLKPSILGWDWAEGAWGCSTVGRAGGGGCCVRVWTTMQQEYPLYWKPLSPFRSHSMSSPRLKSSPLSIPALRPSVCLSVCQMGEPHQKVLDLVLGTEWMHDKGGQERRKTLFVLNWCGGGGTEPNPGHKFRYSDLVMSLSRVFATQTFGLGGLAFIAAFIPPSIPPSLSPPSAHHHHLPASHHQCSQGDERHGEEGPQGINFSHGWESSSQKTWQPQTAWLKKKRREEERRRGHWRRREGGEFFTWWPWERDFGYWVSSPPAPVRPKPPCLGWEWANCSSCSLGIPCVPWSKDVGGHQLTLLTSNRKPGDVLRK